MKPHSIILRTDRESYVKAQKGNQLSKGPEQEANNVGKPNNFTAFCDDFGVLSPKIIIKSGVVLCPDAREFPLHPPVWA